MSAIVSMIKNSLTNEMFRIFNTTATNELCWMHCPLNQNAHAISGKGEMAHTVPISNMKNAMAFIESQHGLINQEQKQKQRNGEELHNEPLSWPEYSNKSTCTA